MTLAVQRYIYVCHALTARQICTVPIFVRVIVVIFVVAVLSQLCRFFEINYEEVIVQSRIDPSKVHCNVFSERVYFLTVQYLTLALI